MEEGLVVKSQAAGHREVILPVSGRLGCKRRLKTAAVGFSHRLSSFIKHQSGITAVMRREDLRMLILGKGDGLIAIGLYACDFTAVGKTKRERPGRHAGYTWRQNDHLFTP